MAATLTWTETAIAQLADIAEYIAQDSPRNAQRAVERIIVAVEGLARFPLRGHIVAEFDRENLRELTWRKYALSTAQRKIRSASSQSCMAHGSLRI